MANVGRRMQFDKERVRWLLKDHNPEEIAGILGCSRTTAYDKARDVGWKKPGRADKKRRKEWREAFIKAKSMTEAGRRMGVSRQSASAMWSKLNREDEEALQGSVEAP